MTLTNPIHIYRSLLREATYLPLPNSRQYIKDYISQSFHRYHPKLPQPGNPKFNTQDGSLPPPSHRHIPIPIPMTLRTNNPLTLRRQTSLLHSARKFHSILQRANQGYTRPLEKILRLTYGRTGRRRHELLSEYMENFPKRPDVQPSTAPSTTNVVPGPISDKISPDWKVPSSIEVLLDSQIKEQTQFVRQGNNFRVRGPFKPMPELDIRGNSITKKRRKNMLHKWYLYNVRAVLPPLPESEYIELRDLVAGDTPMPKQPPRRPMAHVPVFSPPPDDTSPFATQQDQSLLMAEASLIANGPKPGPRAKDIINGRPHRITSRFLRRSLARAVLEQTPSLHIAERVKAGVVFGWDNGNSRLSVRRSAVPAPRDAKLATLLFG